MSTTLIPGDQGLQVAEELSQLAARVSRSTVQVINGHYGGGSGIIWSPDGLIVTNAHVIQRRQARVILWDDRAFTAQILAHNAERDLAALKIEASDLPAASLGYSDTVHVGQLVFAMGNPLGTEKALSSGIIHAVGPLQSRGRHAWLQADVTLHPGNSGGPLVDCEGAVIGVNSMIFGGVALAVPTAAVLDFLAPARRVTLGIYCEQVQPPRSPFGVGLLVMEVSAQGYAKRAGLMIGDVIIAVKTGSKSWQSPLSLEHALRAASRTGYIVLQILRAGVEETCEIQFDPESAGVAAA